MNHDKNDIANHDTAHHRGSLFCLAALLAVFVFISVINIALEPVQMRTTNTAEQFDTARAFERIETILGDESPHPVDSPANIGVRDRLIKQIEALGFTPLITPHDICRVNPSQNYVNCTHVENISFRLGTPPEAGEKDTLLLTAHYDSVPAGPGAGDDMIGVASLLEVAFHLRNQSVDRPVLFLITDGEEIGLFGAKAFVEQDPRFGEIDTVLNFEARGVGGPAFMFETSQPNANVIAAFAQATTQPTSNSLMAGIYEAMPNGTDMTEFLGGGADGLNFAITRNERFYHTPRDNLANLSKRSLQHMGDQALAVTRHMLQQDKDPRPTRLVYTDILGKFMITLPQAVALPILLAGFLLSGFMSLQGTAPIGIVKRLGVFILPCVAIVGAAALSFAVQWTIASARGDAMYWIAHGWASQGFAVLIAMLVVYLLAVRTSAMAGSPATAGGAWFWLTGLGLALNFVLPGATIFILLPTVIFILSALASLFSEKISIVIAGIAAVFSVILWVPTIGGLGESLGFGISFIISAVTAIALLPMMRHFQSARVMNICSLVLLAGVIGFAGLAMGLPKYSANAPRHINVSTYTDAITNKNTIAFIANESGNPIPPALGFEDAMLTKGKILTGNAFEYWHVAAKQPDNVMPAISLNRANADETPATVYRLTGAGGYADRVSLTIPAEIKVTAMRYGQYTQTLNQNESGAVTIRCHGQSCLSRGIEFTTASSSTSNLTLYLDQYGLTKEAALYAANRDEAMVPRQLGDKYTLLQHLTLPSGQ